MVATWDRHAPDEQQRVQGQALQRWLPGVAAYSPFWREHLSHAAIDPTKVNGLDALRQVPPVREVELLERGGPGSPDLLLRPDEEGVKAAAPSETLVRVARGIRRSGASGKRQVLLEEFKTIHLHAAGRDGDLAVAYTRSDLDRLHRAGARAAAVLGLSQDDYLVSAVPARQSLEFWGTYHLALGASMLAVHDRGDGDDLGGVARSFALVPATAVVVPVDEAAVLAVVADEESATLDGVRTVVVVGPPPDADSRAEITEAWRNAGAAGDLRVLALWAPRSARALWAECRAPGRSGGYGHGLHTYPDLDVVELLDPTSGRPVDPDGGDLTITSLGWHGTALVRYQTGDYAAGLDRAECTGCGRTVPRVLPEVVEAAWEPVVEVPEGDLRMDLRTVAAVLNREAAIAAWRVELRRRGSGDTYIVEVGGDLSGDAVAALTDLLEQHTGVVPQVVVDDADAIRQRAAAQGGVFADAR